MADTKLDLAFWNYDRTSALANGTVRIKGVDSTFHSAKIVTEIFEAMVKDRAFDVSELGLTYFLRAIESGDDSLLAIPVFPNRAFRHSAIYINTTKGIRRPEDLAGKRIGELALYSHDAGVMPKGVLSEEYGVTPDQCRWVIGGIDFPLKPIAWLPRPQPEGVEIEYLDADADLGRLLEAGEIDALISADIPECVLRKALTVGRLFENYEQVERDYYRRTGIFPIMHTVVVSKQLAAEHPEVVRAVYQSFCDAKHAAAAQLATGMTFNNMALMIPWITKLIGENRDLLGDDWWPYGIEANRKALDTCLRYHFEQGITHRRLSIEEIFVPYLLAT